MGEMRRAIAREEEGRRKQDRFASPLVIAASIIAAVRLARDDISRPSPRVQSVIVNCVQLARSILNAVVSSSLFSASSDTLHLLSCVTDTVTVDQLKPEEKQREFLMAPPTLGRTLLTTRMRFCDCPRRRELVSLGPVDLCAACLWDR